MTEVTVGEPAGFREFVVARSAALVRSAALLTGEQPLAEDLVQTTLAKVWPAWERIARDGTEEAYVRRAMVNTFLTWNRRRWRGETPVAAPAVGVSPGDEYAEVDVRQVLGAALAGLPRRQRAVVVLRYFDDLTEAQTAAALGCSVGTVKSQAFKALARLRELPAMDELIGEVGTRERA